MQAASLIRSLAKQVQWKPTSQVMLTACDGSGRARMVWSSDALYLEPVAAAPTKEQVPVAFETWWATQKLDRNDADTVYARNWAWKAWAAAAAPAAPAVPILTRTEQEEVQYRRAMEGAVPAPRLTRHEIEEMWAENYAVVLSFARAIEQRVCERVGVRG